MKEKTFNTENVKPQFMLINWSSAKKDSSIYLNNAELVDERNIEFIRNQARREGVELDIAYSQNGVCFFVSGVIKIKSGADVDLCEKVREFVSLNYECSIDEIIAGVGRSRLMVKRAIEHLLKMRLIKASQCQTGDYGRPATVYNT